MAARRLEVQISADARQFYRTVNRVGEYVWRYGKVIAGMGAAGFSAWAYAVKKAADFGDSIAKAADRTGMATDALQGLRYAAVLSGASLEDVENAVFGMSKVLTGADQGAKASIDTLSALGLSLADLKGKSVAEQFNAFMVALSAVEDPAKRMVLAQEALGKSGRKLLPMIAGGAEAYRELVGLAESRGIIFSSDQIAAAVRFNDKLTEAKETLYSAIRVGAAGAFDPLSASLDRLMDPAVVEGVTQAMATISEALVPMVDGFAKLAASERTMVLLREGVDSLSLALEIGLKAIEAYAWYWDKVSGVAKFAGGAVGAGLYAGNEQAYGMAASEGQLEAFRAMVEEQKATRALLEARMPQAEGGTS